MSEPLTDDQVQDMLILGLTPRTLESALEAGESGAQALRDQTGYSWTSLRALASRWGITWSREWRA